MLFLELGAVFEYHRQNEDNQNKGNGDEVDIEAERLAGYTADRRFHDLYNCDARNQSDREITHLPYHTIAERAVTDHELLHQRPEEEQGDHDRCDVYHPINDQQKRVIQIKMQVFEISNMGKKIKASGSNIHACRNDAEHCLHSVLMMEALERIKEVLVPSGIPEKCFQLKC